MTYYYSSIADTLRRLATAFTAIYLLFARVQAGEDFTQPASRIDADGMAHLPALSVPLSSLSSDEAKKNFLDFVHGFDSVYQDIKDKDDINAWRKSIDNLLMRPGVEKLRSIFAVNIHPEMIAGVQTDIIEPATGIAAKNKRRLLINLHGGGFTVGARLGGQMESIPIASIGAIKVITVDYREGPEYKFPAGSEDVAAVYRDLLKKYPPENIGIYGCSAGAILAAESLAWFQKNQLPTPGAVGIFGGGALPLVTGDSNYVNGPLMDEPIWPEDIRKVMPYFDVPAFNIKDPLVSPVYSPSLLARFPPSLLISGTRDPSLSAVVFSHAQLVKAGVKADLHVWEGAAHCSFAQPVVNANVPETREAWDVIVKFFESNLGS